MTRAPSARPKLACRLCDHTVLLPALTLTPTPPANDFVTEPVTQECFPLEVNVCEACGHAQLSQVVDAESLFRDYVYVSGTSPVFRKHFEEYAKSVSGRVGLMPGELVCEIGSNDGTLLRCFPDARILGIEPATQIAQAANASGVTTINEFFSRRIADSIRGEHGSARLVLANNVMAHIDDLGGVLDGVTAMLTEDGLFVMEVQYVGDLLRDGLFDMVYFEHLDYHAVSPLVPFFEKHGLKLIDVEHVGTHGGSIRCYAAKPGGAGASEPAPRVEEFRRNEEKDGLLTVKPWELLRGKIEARKNELRTLLASLKAAGRTIVGYGAPAKLTTLLYTFEIGAETLDYVVEDSPLKIGRYTPGLHIPVRAPTALYEDGSKPDAILICAWNFAKAIIDKHPKLTGVSWITPLPELTVIS